MEWIILLGFELEVYQPHEFAGMYWYLQHYVRTKIGHIERIRQFAALNPKLTSKQKKKKVLPAVEQQKKALSLLTFYLLEASAIQELSGAMINVYTVLARLDLLKKPPQPYSSDLLRYDLRMKPFLTIGCPEVVPFDIFETLVNNPEIQVSTVPNHAFYEANCLPCRHWNSLSSPQNLPPRHEKILIS